MHWRRSSFALICFLFILGLFYLLYNLPYRTQAPVLGGTVDTAVRNSSSTLIVSAFFHLSKSKHTIREYEWWLCQFLGPITTDIYFYTSVEMVSLVRKCRGDLPITIDTSFATPFDVPPLQNLQDIYRGQLELDRERKIHQSEELYASWNAKPFFLDEAAKTLARQGITYDYVFWNDAGSFRISHGFTDWPSISRVRDIWREGSALSGEKEQDLLFFPVCRVPHPSYTNWEEHMGPIDGYFSEASFFGGSPQTVTRWRETYYAYHDHYLRQGHFVGKDQNLIFSLFLLFPSRIISVWLDDPDAPAHKGLGPVQDTAHEGFLGSCGENWFYYQFWVANLVDRVAMNKIWEKAALWSWGGWRRRRECRLTRVVWVKDLLHR
ncbi:hypothetical protein R3P38DRAFT_3318131 [Favolaschia claudopus]|uniref:Uncharacterized protein n=1 Tax=Favolaschia claudopus TaxID=2862362 RepID=A0AAW0B6E6_9AGAR